MEKAEKLIAYLEDPWRSLEPVIPRRLLPSGYEFYNSRMRRNGIFIEAVGTGGLAASINVCLEIKIVSIAAKLGRN